MNSNIKILVVTSILFCTAACSPSTLEYKSSTGTVVRVKKENVNCVDYHSRIVLSPEGTKYCTAYGTEKHLNGQVKNWQDSAGCGPKMTFTSNRITCKAAKSAGRL